MATEENIAKLSEFVCEAGNEVCSVIMYYYLP